MDALQGAVTPSSPALRAVILSQELSEAIRSDVGVSWVRVGDTYKTKIAGGHPRLYATVQVADTTDGFLVWCERTDGHLFTRFVARPAGALQLASRIAISWSEAR